MTRLEIPHNPERIRRKLLIRELIKTDLEPIH